MSHSLTLAGDEFQTDGAATQNARRAGSVLVSGTDNTGAAANLRVLTGVAVSSMSMG